MSDALPIPDFDHLTVATVTHRIRSLDPAAVEELLEHEQAHSSRMPVLEVLRTRLQQLQEGAEPSGGDQSTSRDRDTAHGSPVDPSTAAPPEPPARHGLRQVTWGG
jgi:hypothetical protein